MEEGKSSSLTIQEETKLSKNANCKVENGVILLRKKKIWENLE